MSNELLKTLIRNSGLDDDLFPIEDWDNPELYALIHSVVDECCEMMLKMESKYPANLTVREIKKQFGMISE